MIKPSFLELESQTKKDMIDYATFKPKCGVIAFPDHWHDNIELIFVKSGKIEISLGAKMLVAKKNDVCFCNTNLIHGAVSRSDSLEYDMIQIKYDALKQLSKINRTAENLLNHEINIACCFPDCRFESFCIRAKYLAKRSDNKSLAELSFVCEIFDYLLQHHQTDEKVAMYSNQKFAKIIEYLNEHHKEKIAISDISKMFSFDTSYFSRKFKEIVGLTPSNYVSSLRVFSAEKLLLSTDKSIDFIASECGFESVQYFIRCFKAKFGISPLKYRKSAQNNTPSLPWR